MKQSRRSEFNTGITLPSMALSIYLTIALSLLGSLLGCAASGEAFKPAEKVPGMSLIYFFRTQNVAASGMDEHLYLNGKKVAQLSPGGYYVSLVIPGEHTVAAKMLVSMFNWQEIHTKLITVPDRSHYVKVGTDITFSIGVYTEMKRRIEILEEENALPLLTTMKLQKQSPGQ